MSILTTAVLAGCASVALAGPPDARTIARYMDDAGIACLHVDLERADIAGFLRHMGMNMGDTQAREDLSGPEREARRWQERVRAAGAREVLAFVSLRLDERGPIGIVVPLRPGADGAAIAAAFENAGARVIDGAVVIGVDTPAVPAGEERIADIERAIAEAGGDSDGTLVVVPAPFARRAIAELVPALPPELGGGPTTELTDGLLWSGGAIDLPPDGALRVVVRSRDGEAAAAFARLATTALDSLAEEANKHGEVPAIAELRRRLDIRARGESVVLELAKDSDDVVTRAVAEAFGKARGEARAIKHASMIRAALMGCVIHAADNRESWPEKLQPLVDNGMIPAEVLTQKRHEGGELVYRRPTPEQLRVSPALAVMHEGFGTWPAGGIWVGFTDGHVEHVGTEKAFRELWARW